MLKILLRLIGLCDHKRSVYKELNVFGSKGEIPEAKIIVLCCDKCGNIKKKEISSIRF